MRTMIGLVVMLLSLSVVNADPIVAVALGDAHSCALVRSGQVACWGTNLVGQLGDGAREDHADPRPVVGLDGVIQIAAFGAIGAASCRKFPYRTSARGRVGRFLGRPDLENLG